MTICWPKKNYYRGGQLVPYSIYVYIYQTGDEPQKQDTQANKRSPLLSEEVPYQITLIRLRQGSLDRRRREHLYLGRFLDLIILAGAPPLVLA